MALVGISRQPRWKVGHLLTMLAALDHSEGFAPVQTLLEAGLLFPELDPHNPSADDFAAWFGLAGTLNAVVFAHPGVAVRARGEDLGLPSLANPDREVGGSAHQADGFEWPLRLAAVWQQVHADAVRLTQGNTLFKRDLVRLQADPVLAAPPVDQLAPIADPGVLALLWARAAGLLGDRDGTLEADTFPPTWDGPLFALLAEFFAALPLVEPWDPLAGYSPTDNTLALSATPTAGFLSLLLAREFVNPDAVAEWLWTHHPSWAGTIPNEAAADKGAGWVRGYLLGVAYPLGLVEVSGKLVRLSAFGRFLLFGEAEPAPPPAFPQTLLVQPNAEVLAYRQGLTPSLIASLSRFAGWKGIGPACTLELTPEQTYRGLESGLTLPMIVQTLNRHGTRPVPPGVADLLQRWASKRERITIFSSAVLVEFQTPAELDTAVSRGVVTLRLTDRIGMTADGGEPSLSHLRLIGNRDYESRPQRCLTVADDGVTLTVDTPQADLLLEAEIGQFAEPLPIEPNGVRKFRLTPESLRRAADGGRPLADIDAWFAERSGAPLSAAGRLLLLGADAATASGAVARGEVADGGNGGRGGAVAADAGVRGGAPRAVRGERGRGTLRGIPRGAEGVGRGVVVFFACGTGLETGATSKEEKTRSFTLRSGSRRWWWRDSCRCPARAPVRAGRRSRAVRPRPPAARERPSPPSGTPARGTDCSRPARVRSRARAAAGRSSR